MWKFSKPVWHLSSKKYKPMPMMIILSKLIKISKMPHNASISKQRDKIKEKFSLNSSPPFTPS
jgi:hypothetical protein